jgi:hypothetical protein
MTPDIDRELEGEVTRTEAVRYLQGALGHAVGSLLFLVFAGVLWVAEYRQFALFGVLGAALISANGFSIWAWDRLREYFTARTGGESGSTRTLQARPFSDESLVEMKSGAVIMLSFFGLLMLGRLLVGVLSPWGLAGLGVGALALGNVVALVRAHVD